MNPMHLGEQRRPRRGPRRPGHWVEQSLSQTFHQFCSGETWKPCVNAYENDRAFYIVVDLAGLDAEHIDLRVDEGVLELTGQRETPRPADTPGPLQVRLMEIDQGRFTRTIQLPPTVDPDRIEATYRGGLLWITLPKRG